MREFAKVAPRFWTGETGRIIRAQGPDSLVVALYLLTAPHANMLGLYYLPIPFICHETGLPHDRVSSAMDGLASCDFLRYDHQRELVWVRQMAHFQIGPSLKPADKRVAGIHTLIKSIPPSPLVEQFIHHYRHPFHLDQDSKADAADLFTHSVKRDQGAPHTAGGVSNDKTPPQCPQNKQPPTTGESRDRGQKKSLVARNRAALEQRRG
jgi:hypothetical protein